MAAAMPEWHSPPAPTEAVAQRLPKLTIYNSLTRGKTPFVPLDPEGQKVTWYACGPTVYDDAHLGHARNYVSTDIIRRILSDYFRFRVSFVMNVTDVDDKIILAARQQHLLAEYLDKHAEIDGDVRDATRQAFTAYTEKNLPLLYQDSEGVTPETYTKRVESTYGHVLAGKSVANDGSAPGDTEAKVKMYLNTAKSAVEALTQTNLSRTMFEAKASGVLLPYLDSQYGSKIQGKDHAIFTKLTKKYENRFFEDMRALNVRYPDTLTRVTEYGPEIVDFVKRIQDNGFAYEHEGSVYYDTNAWESSGGVYARLEPWNRNDKDLQADGEGALSAKKTGFKRSGADFALWKASKPGEPSWPSPWGEGRPGWHIECSAMASNVLGKQFDIHSGGIDLAFPHHDNELAQSEAYWAKSGKDSKQWVNYFMHMGHLSIQGSKMSKSLKNFTTVREALAKGEWTERSLRIVFLLGAWRDGLEISSEMVKGVTAWEDRVNNFFLKVRDLQRNPTNSHINSNASNGAAPDLMDALAAAQNKFHEALCDSFDTPTAMRIISDLITAYNSASHVPDSVSLSIGKWITEMVNIFGLDSSPSEDKVGWSGIDIPDQAKPFIYPLSNLRDSVRTQARAGGTVEIPDQPRSLVDKESKSEDTQPYANAYSAFRKKVLDLTQKSALSKDYLAICDQLRDVTLWDLDIYLEDRDGQPALVRPLDQSLRQERQDRDAVAAAKAAAKDKAKQEEKERLEKGKLNPLDLFRTSEYSAWDPEGLPTMDAEGKEVAKSKGKKLRKDWERQKKLHEAWKAANAGA